MGSPIPKSDGGNEPPAPPSRRRRRPVRASTISTKRLPKRELEIGRAMYPMEESESVQRPLTRAWCEDGPRPCPFVSCVHHLYLDVSGTSGAIKVNFPDVDVENLEELPETCSLDVAENGGETLERVANILNLTRERVRQIEARALEQVRAVLRGADLHEEDVCSRSVHRRLPILGETDDDGDLETLFDVDRFAGAELD
jgi:hypothetical protein